jgi:hypothetical protein
MAETDDIEFDLLRRRADEAGFFVQRHRDYDPCRGGGDLYLQEKRELRRDRMPSLLKYATADQIHEFLNRRT